MNRLLFPALAALLLPLGRATAQDNAVTLDVGAARLRFADRISASAISITPAIRVSAPRASLNAFGTFSRLGGASSNSGSVDASLFSDRLGALSGELEGVAGGSAHSDGARTGQMLGLVRLHVMAAARGLWVGGGAGRTWDGIWRSLVQGDAGAWLTRDANTLSLSVSPTMVEDTIRYTDIFFAARHETARWYLSGSVGVRAGAQIPTLPAERKVWGNLGATIWMTPRVGFVASAGTYPVDVSQGYPGGQFVSLSVRVRTAAPVVPAARVRGETVAEAPGSVRRFDVRRLSGDRHLMRIYAPTAHSVEVTGDFTQWTPVRLRAEAGGWWTTSLDLVTGSHQLNVRVDGEEWQVPPGLTKLVDEFGGTVGLLFIR